MTETKHEIKESKSIGISIDKKTVIATVLVILAFTSGFLLSAFARSTASTQLLSNERTPQSASDTAIRYINENLVQPGTSASFVSAAEVGDMYNVTISYQGRDTFVFVTKDGSYLFLSPPLNIAVEPPKQPSDEPQKAQVDVSAEDDPSMGPENAKVTIIEFSDYQCPYCKKAEPTIKQIVQEYGDKVRFVYRDFPLSFHQNAQKAAEASECADEQGKYWEYHDKLFEKSHADGTGLNVDDLKQYAEDLSLDTAKFDECLDSGKMSSEVQKDFQDGQSYGVSGTPAFFINGKKLSGAQPFDAFKQIIDSELA